jgi:hypothetical protein
VAGTAQWVKVNDNGTKFPGTNMPTLTAAIPARATVQRIVHHLVIGGVGTSTQALGYLSIEPVYLLKTINTTNRFGVAHQLHYSNYIIPLAVTSMFDSTQVPPVGQNRIFYGFYQAGDKEVGDNIKTSWGGPLYTNPYNITLVNGVFYTGAGSANPFQYQYTSQLHVLYYA